MRDRYAVTVWPCVVVYRSPDGSGAKRNGVAGRYWVAVRRDFLMIGARIFGRLVRLLDDGEMNFVWQAGMGGDAAGSQRVG